MRPCISLTHTLSSGEKKKKVKRDKKRRVRGNLGGREKGKEVSPKSSEEALSKSRHLTFPHKKGGRINFASKTEKPSIGRILRGKVRNARVEGRQLLKRFAPAIRSQEPSED